MAFSSFSLPARLPLQAARRARGGPGPLLRGHPAAGGGILTLDGGPGGQGGHQGGIGRQADTHVSGGNQTA